MVLSKALVFFLVFFGWELVFSEGAWAWGPAVHTVIAFRMIEHLKEVLPGIAGIIQGFPLEFLYGGLAADFFVGKGQKTKEGHSHSWETGFRVLGRAGDDRELSYAYGFLSHLAEDVVAHNYFVPNLVHHVSTWKRLGHIYWEVKADHLVGPVYLRIAKEILTMEGLDCDDLLRFAAMRRGRGIKARRRLYTHSVSFSDYLSSSQSVSSKAGNGGHEISPTYLGSMIDLSFRLAKDFLTRPDSSPCLSYDPIGSRNLRLAGRNGLLSRLFDLPRPRYTFAVDRELLNI